MSYRRIIPGAELSLAELLLGDPEEDTFPSGEIEIAVQLLLKVNWDHSDGAPRLHGWLVVIPREGPARIRLQR